MVIKKNDNEKYQAAAGELREAAQGEDGAAFEAAAMRFAAAIEQSILAEAQQLAAADADAALLAARGVRQLTSAERKYYNAVIGAMRDAHPMQALANLDVAMPETVIDQIFDDLETEHPLLAAIDFRNVGGVGRWLMNTNEEQKATWSALTAEIVKELSSGFKEIDVAQNKLSAFLPVSKAMLDLGPEWLDRYVRAVLAEALSLGLEDGVINGRGQNANIHEPIGMIRDMSASVSQSDGYAAKTAIAVTALDAATYGGLLATLSQTEKGIQRKVNNVILVVNPVDYFKKIMPATTYLTPGGAYVNNVLPFPTEIIQSSCMTEGRAVIGIGDKYLFVGGIGKDGITAFSDEVHFLEDERVYLSKLYGHGQPKDNNSFLLLDISGLEPVTLKVTNVTPAADNANGENGGASESGGAETPAA